MTYGGHQEKRPGALPRTSACRWDRLVRGVPERTAICGVCGINHLLALSVGLGEPPRPGLAPEPALAHDLGRRHRDEPVFVALLCHWGASVVEELAEGGVYAPGLSVSIGAVRARYGAISPPPPQPPSAAALPSWRGSPSPPWPCSGPMALPRSAAPAMPPATLTLASVRPRMVNSRALRRPARAGAGNRI